jgi:hypothetical protein
MLSMDRGTTWVTDMRSDGPANTAAGLPGRQLANEWQRCLPAAATVTDARKVEHHREAVANRAARLGT